MPTTSMTPIFQWVGSTTKANQSTLWTILSLLFYYRKLQMRKFYHQRRLKIIKKVLFEEYSMKNKIFKRKFVEWLSVLSNPNWEMGLRVEKLPWNLINIIKNDKYSAKLTWKNLKMVFNLRRLWVKMQPTCNQFEF